MIMMDAGTGGGGPMAVETKEMMQPCLIYLHVHHLCGCVWD